MGEYDGRECTANIPVGLGRRDEIFDNARIGAIIVDKERQRRLSLSNIIVARCLIQIAAQDNDCPSLRQSFVFHSK